jgi:hypothetical protein
MEATASWRFPSRRSDPRDFAATHHRSAGCIVWRFAGDTVLAIALGSGDALSPLIFTLDISLLR